MKTQKQLFRSAPPARPRGPLGRTLCLVVALCSGCTVLTYTAPNGERFTRGSLGASTAIASLAVESGSNGVRRVEMHGYRNDSNQALTTVTEALIRAAARN